MTSCASHPYSLLSPLGCPSCEGERLAAQDRLHGRRVTKVQLKKRRASLVTDLIAEVTVNGFPKRLRLAAG